MTTPTPPSILASVVNAMLPAGATPHAVGSYVSIQSQQGGTSVFVVVEG